MAENIRAIMNISTNGPIKTRGNVGSYAMKRVGADRPRPSANSSEVWAQSGVADREPMTQARQGFLKA